MSVILQLPRDILHSIYLEWLILDDLSRLDIPYVENNEREEWLTSFTSLGWKDLSNLDIACVEKNVRKDWLASLTDLRMTETLLLNDVFPNHKMSSFYKWLGSRKVFCVEAFIVMPDVLEDLVGGLLDMESFCSAIRSFEIYTWSSDERSSDVDQVKNNLSVFLGHCRNLQGVTVRTGYSDGYFESINDIVMSVLVEKLRANSLVKISLDGCYGNDKVVGKFLRKHASSLQDLNLCDIERMKLITFTLIKNRIRLRVLSVDMKKEYFNIPEMTRFLISYLSSTGDLLEDLKVDCYPNAKVHGLVLSVLTSCPKLTRFHFGGPCSLENLRQLFEQCPYLQYVSIEGIMKINEDKNSVSIEVKGSNDDWAICLSHIVRRRQCKQVTLSLREVYYHSTVNLKSILEPYQICVQSYALETSLISLLQDLPHVNSLYVAEAINRRHADATLSAITEHANSLTELTVRSNFSEQFHRIISDRRLSELIKHCQSLKKLSVLSCGLDIIMAASKHSNVNTVNLSTDDSIYEESLDRLLLDKNLKWPSTLEDGSVNLHCRFFYKFDKEGRYWTKRG
eukprot:scaffold548_cov190-Ochromonas_danica.AAC.3